MTRYWFGDSDDWTINASGKPTSAVTRYYTAEVGGTQHTDLLIGGTKPADSVATSGPPVRFQGPDGVLSMWASANDGPRFLVQSTDTTQVMVDAAAGVVDGVSSVMAAAAADEDSDFRATLDTVVDTSVEAQAVGRTARTQHAPALGLYFPEAEGALWNGSHDDTASIQAALAAASTAGGGTVALPPGNGKVTADLYAAGTVRIISEGAGQYLSRIITTATTGNILNVAGGVSGFQMENVELAAAVRYTTTPNTLTGLAFNGTTGSRPQNAMLRNVYIDGCRTAIMARYLWNSLFDNVHSNYGLIGLDIYGLAVNNVVVNCRLSVAIIAGSRTIRFAGVESPTDSTAVANEGWIIAHNLIYGGEIGVEIKGTTHVQVTDNIIDFNQIYGVRITDNGTNFGGNSRISGNYIAMTGSGGIAAISLANTIDNVQRRRNRVTENHCITYSGSTCAQGIYVSGAYGTSTLLGNVLAAFTIDIYLSCIDNMVTNNQCLSTPGAAGNIYPSPYKNLIADNIGVVYRTAGEPLLYRRDAQGRKIYTGTQAPTTGTHAVGDAVENNPVPVQYSFNKLVCTVAGTPGTWAVSGGFVGPLTATTAQLASLTDPVNTVDKVAGKSIHNTSTKKLVTADGATAAAVWNDATGTLAHTPV